MEFFNGWKNKINMNGMGLLLTDKKMELEN